MVQQALPILADGLDSTAEAGSALPTEHSPPTYVVGIGASAGGLEALEAFVEQLLAEEALAQAQ